MWPLLRTPALQECSWWWLFLIFARTASTQIWQCSINTSWHHRLATDIRNATAFWCHVDFGQECHWLRRPQKKWTLNSVLPTIWEGPYSVAERSIKACSDCVRCGTQSNILGCTMTNTVDKILPETCSKILLGIFKELFERRRWHQVWIFFHSFPLPVGLMANPEYTS